MSQITELASRQKPQLIEGTPRKQTHESQGSRDGQKGCNKQIPNWGDNKTWLQG